ncbi:tetratricopeptide repeat protein 4 like protein [Babesia gibsoni]|uniref:Tetratricopeptide repeat protein 4 like protein n=1 Tax=Babesia gibsoni TaxID=33632 RepID=A0AAD8PFE7_BABGI|nr:tetratricopeptide repeat protein 4 like protein [Babesia gibsoni]
MEEDDYHIDADFLRKFTDQYGDVEHPLFMEEIPRDSSGNEDLEALQQLLAEGETRDSIAEKYKQVGNGYVQQGEYYYEAAISSYTNGIEAQSKDKRLNSLLYLNRAFVHLKRKDYVKCVDDCRKCIALDPTNLKAYYRGAVASYELALYKRALRFCLDYYDQIKQSNGDISQDVLDTLTAASPDCANIYKRVLSKLKEQEEQLRVFMQKERETKAKEMKDAKDAVELLTNNGIKLKNNLYEVPESQNVVFYHEGGLLHTSCLIIYDEYNITDYIENLDYSTTIGDHLDVMFPDSTDPKGFYRKNSRCLYEVVKHDLQFNIFRFPRANSLSLERRRLWQP